MRAVTEPWDVRQRGLKVGGDTFQGQSELRLGYLHRLCCSSARAPREERNLWGYGCPRSMWELLV